MKDKETKPTQFPERLLINHLQADQKKKKNPEPINLYTTSTKIKQNNS